MGCEGLMKAFLVSLNFIFFSLGGAILGIGIWIKIDKAQLLTLTKKVSGQDLSTTDVPSLLENAVIVIIATGAAVFVIGLLGCFGAMQSKSSLGRVMLKVYASIVLIILLVEIAGVILAWFFFDDVETKLHEYLDLSLAKYKANYTFSANTTSYTSNGDFITLAWDTVQLEFECCGHYNGSDYDGSKTPSWESYRTVINPNGVSQAMVVPPSCCKMSGSSSSILSVLKSSYKGSYSLAEPMCPFSAVNASTPGCYDKVKQTIKAQAVIIGAIGAGLLFIELVCVICACCLSKRDKNSVEAIKD